MKLVMESGQQCLLLVLLRDITSFIHHVQLSMGYALPFNAGTMINGLSMIVHDAKLYSGRQQHETAVEHGLDISRGAFG